MYILDPDTTLALDFKVNFIGFMTWLCVQATAFLSFDIAILRLTYGCITMSQHVVYILDPCMTWTIDFYVGDGGYL